MSHIINIGNKIKEIRNENNLTLKQLSERTNLSIGFLSQVERGISNIAIDTLQVVANALNVEISTFIKDELTNNNSNNPIIRSFERNCSIINNTLHSYIMTNDSESLTFLPRIYHLLPSIDSDTQPETYNHSGYEWIYVVEGILSVTYNNQLYDLYPGDCMTINSNQKHNWFNRTNKVAKFIAINTPNPISQIDDK